MKCFDYLNCEPCPPGIFTCSHYAELIRDPNKDIPEPCDAFLEAMTTIDAMLSVVVQIECSAIGMVAGEELRPLQKVKNIELGLDMI